MGDEPVNHRKESIFDPLSNFVYIIARSCFKIYW